jgi:hypothetical protein
MRGLSGRGVLWKMHEKDEILPVTLDEYSTQTFPFSSAVVTNPT